MTPTGLILDDLAIHLRHPDAAGLAGFTPLELTDTSERHQLELSHGVLHHRSITDDEHPIADATLTTTRTWLNALLATDDPAGALRSGEGVMVQGDTSMLLAVFEHLDDFPFRFDIVSP